MFSYYDEPEFDYNLDRFVKDPSTPTTTTPNRFSNYFCGSTTTPTSNLHTPPSSTVSNNHQDHHISGEYRNSLSAALFQEDDLRSSMSSSSQRRSGLFTSPVHHQPATTTKQYDNLMGVCYARNKARHFQSKSFRIIPQTPERILDAPDLLDDFYLNLIDWSAKNVLAVALNQTVYLWYAATGDIQQLMSTHEDDNIVTSVSWNADGTILAVGTNSCEVQFWDVSSRLLKTVPGHRGRVGSLAWSGSVLASGSRDSTIGLCDVRTYQRTATLQAHTQEVCGLRWSSDGTQLASGGNDNLLYVWDHNRLSQECRPRLRLTQHTAAVKALAWNPQHPQLLASGGGTADKTLRFWDTHTGQCLHHVDTRSQVCSIVWSLDGNELVTSHGYSDNQLVLWKYPSLKRMADLTGHTSRVLHLALSPDGQLVVSAAGDETIRFWKCFAQSNKGNSTTSRRKSTRGRMSSGHEEDATPDMDMSFGDEKNYSALASLMESSSLTEMTLR
eukprot:PhF_6_TR22279/c0_g1_i1/m.31513/K03363/CDC20; cell division cycle 20, cofactor of APC complex